MSIKINTRFGEVVTSQAINEKVNTLFGGNAIIEGFDVSKKTNTSICITPGKAIVCGASIEEDEETINLNIPMDLLTAKTLYVVIEYVHETRSVKYKIVAQVLANMVTLAQITMVNSVIDIVENSRKTLQLNELSEVAKDLETGLLNTQYLEVSGEDITLTDGYKSKTENMKLKGNTKQNLVLVPNKEAVISCEYSAGPNYSHNLKDTKSGCIDTVIQGNTVQNLVKATENKEVIPSGMLSLDGACNHKIDGSKAGFVDVSIKGKTIKNLINEVNPYSSAHVSGNVCTMESLESGYAITEIKLKHSLKASTKYTIFINVLETSNQKFSLDSFGMDFEWTSNLANISSVGLNKIVFTTPSETARLKIQMNGNPGNLVKFNINMLLVEGDWTSSEFDEIPCIDGIVGVGEKSKNLFSGYEPGSIDLTGTGGDVASSTVFRSKYIEVKPNTKYTLSQEKSICYYDTNKARITNNYCNNFITPNNCHYIRFQSSTNEDMYMSEGKVAINEPYYEGHKIEILSHGKNLLYDTLDAIPSYLGNANDLDVYSVINGKHYYGATGQDYRNTHGSPMLSCKPNTTYSISLENPCRIEVGNPITGKKIADTNNFKTHLTFTTESNQHYMSLKIWRSDYINTEKKYLIGDIQIEESPTPTSYEPYTEDKTQILLDEPLHYLTPNVYDEVTVDGELIRNVGKIVFDGSENWRFNSNNDTNILFECLDLGLPTSLDAIISDKFESIQSLWNEIQGGSTQEGIDIGGVQGSRFIQISINQSRLASASTSAFSDWLKKNPITVLYEAAEKEVTKIDIPRIATFDGTTYIKSSNEVQPEIKIDSKGNKYPVLIKPSTKYTIRWFAKGGDTNLDLDLGGTKLSANKTASIVKVTTPATLVHEDLYIAGWGTTISDVAVMETYMSISDTPYVDGIKNVGDKSKNLLDENYLDGYVDDVTGEFVEDQDKTATNFVEVEPSTQYILSKNGFSQRSNVLYYDKDKKFIKKNESLEQPFKTTENCKFIRMHWNKSTINNNHQVQLEKGTKVTSYAPHYKGYKVTVKSCSKNLFNINTLKVKNAQSYEVSGSRIDFVTTGSYGGFLFDHNNLVPGKTYTLSYKGHNSRVFVTYADGTYSHNAITAKDGVFIKSTFTIPENKKILYIQCENSNTGATSAWIDEIQIEESGEFSSYENYKEDVKEYFLDEPLRRLPNGVYDEITVDGELVKRVSSVVLDGAFDIYCSAIVDGVRFRWVVFESNNIKKQSTPEPGYICDTINTMLPVDTWEGREGICVDSKNKRIYIYRDEWSEHGNSETREIIKQWLKDNPATMYYELENPIIIPLDMQVVLPNGVHDKVCDDGTVERRIRKITLNGSERIVNGLELSNSIVFYIHDIIDNRLIDNTNLKCDRFDSDVVYNVDKEGVYSTVDGSNSNIIVIRILKQKLKTLDVEGFKKWLSENPTTIWYELAEPYKENYVYNKPRLSTYSGITHIYSNNKVMSKIGINSKGEKYAALLKPNTKYTIRLSNLNSKDIGLDLGGAKAKLSSQNKAEITTPSTLEHTNLYVSGWDARVKDIMILENSDNYYYIDGVAGVGDKSKNLFNGALKVGAYANANGVYQPNTANYICCKESIKVSPDKDYVISLADLSVRGIDVHYRRSDKSFIKRISVRSSTHFTTDSDCEYITFNIPSTADTTTRVKLEEGTIATLYQEHWEGHKIEILSTGKNVFDLKKFSDKTNLKVTDKGFETTAYTNDTKVLVGNMLKPNTRYVFQSKFDTKGTVTSASGQVRFVNRNVTPNHWVNPDVNSGEFITPSNISEYFIYVYGSNEAGVISTIEDIQIEEAESKTPYAPYQGNSWQTLLDEPLMSLPNGVCDEIVDGKLIRRVGKIVFNGSEDWSCTNYENQKTSRYRYRHDITNINIAPKLNSVGICDKFPVYPNSQWRQDIELIENDQTRINIRKNIYNDIDKFKEWLKLNPTTVYYELETPIITDISKNINVKTYSGTTLIGTVGKVKGDLKFKSPNNLRAITRRVTERIAEAEKLVDELLLPNIVETDYERTLLEFDYDMEKYLL